MNEPVLPSPATPVLRNLWIVTIVVGILVGAYVRLHPHSAWPPPSRHPSSLTTFHETDGVQHWTVAITNAAHAGTSSQCLRLVVTSDRGVTSSCGFFDAASTRANPNNELAPLQRGAIALGPTPQTATAVIYSYWVSPQGNVACTPPSSRQWQRHDVRAATTALPVGSESGRWYEVVLPPADHCFHSFVYVSARGKHLTSPRF